MKTFIASQLSHAPAKVFEEARLNGAIIQQKRTNGDVIEEFVIILKSDYKNDDFYNRISQVSVGLKDWKGVALDTSA